MNKNIFLVEKRSSLNEHRPSLALARYSTLHKEQEDEVYHIIVSSDYKLPGVVPDKIYVSIVFSWDVPKLVKFINKLKYLYPSLKNGDIVIGGVAPFYMWQTIIDGTGIEPLMGCSKELDHVIPDPTFYDNDTTYVFTMRSCPNHCKFCVVNDIEKDFYVIDNWKEQINLKAKNIVIFDNNLLSAPAWHRKEVLEYLAQIANVNGTRIEDTRKVRTVSFEGGLDWRFLTEENLELLKQIKFSSLRVAFDDIRYEHGFDLAMQRLLKAFPRVSSRGLHENIECYVLYNCPYTKDTIEDTLYRVYKLLRYYKVFPYVMRFQPLDTLSYKTYVSPFWNKRDAVDIGRWANNRRVLPKVPLFSRYYGRKSDGKCVSGTSNIERDVLNRLEYDITGIEFSKSFKDNLAAIQTDLEQRKRITQSINECVQLQLAI